MSETAKIMCGVILITIPTIQFGGHFLLSVLSGKRDNMELTGFQKSMFRAGHAHAGVIVILSLICQLLLDGINLDPTPDYLLRASVPLSAILISGGFFAAAAGKGRTTPGKGIILVIVGSILLAVSLILMGVLLLT